MGDYDGEYEVYFQVKFSGANDQEPVTKKGCYTVDGGDVDSEEEAEDGQGQGEEGGEGQ